jgi:hypothetical protein
MYGLPQRTVGALASWLCALLLPAQAHTLAGTDPPNCALLRDGLAPALGAVHTRRTPKLGRERDARGRGARTK